MDRIFGFSIILRLWFEGDFEMQAFGNQGPMATRGESVRRLFSFIKLKETIGEQEVGLKSWHSIWTLGTVSSLGFKKADVLKH